MNKKDLQENLKRLISDKLQQVYDEEVIHFINELPIEDRQYAMTQGKNIVLRMRAILSKSKIDNLKMSEAKDMIKEFRRRMDHAVSILSK